ncbi:hypothetical protein KCU78_g4181, partial [Aureobasidium melanogenum]
MSEVMALRTQILENLKALRDRNLEGRQFVSTLDGDERWIVFLGDPDFPWRCVLYMSDYHGKGATIEEAYTNMLKQTARELYRCYHEKDLFGPISH